MTFLHFLYIFFSIPVIKILSLDSSLSLDIQKTFFNTFNVLPIYFKSSVQPRYLPNIHFAGEPRVAKDVTDKTEIFGISKNPHSHWNVSHRIFHGISITCLDCTGSKQKIKRFKFQHRDRTLKPLVFTMKSVWRIRDHPILRLLWCRKDYVLRGQ